MPTSEEFARIVNENRIGRDLVEAMNTTADRMASQDFRWVAEAVAVQRDTGGNLNEVLDNVGATIRERNHILREVQTLSAEGRMSAVILMVLPIFVGLGMTVTNPGYMAPLFEGMTGYIVLGVRGVPLHRRWPVDACHRECEGVDMGPVIPLIMGVICLTAAIGLLVPALDFSPSTKKSIKARVRAMTAPTGRGGKPTEKRALSAKNPDLGVLRRIRHTGCGDQDRASVWGSPARRRRRCRWSSR